MQITCPISNDGQEICKSGVQLVLPNDCQYHYPLCHRLDLGQRRESKFHSHCSHEHRKHVSGNGHQWRDESLKGHPHGVDSWGIISRHAQAE